MFNRVSRGGNSRRNFVCQGDLRKGQGRRSNMWLVREATKIIPLEGPMGGRRSKTGRNVIPGPVIRPTMK